MLTQVKVVKKTRMIRLSLVCVVVFGPMILSFSSVRASDIPVLVGVGGSFTAINSNKQLITEKDLQGKPVLMAFGYTNCADVCPVTLAYMDGVYQHLTPDEQKQVQFVFVTVDPTFDTPEHLKSYLAYFNSEFLGITGSQAQVDKIAENYKVNVHLLSDDKVHTKHIRRIDGHMADDSGVNDGSKEMVMEDNINMSHDNQHANLYSHSAHMFVIDKDMQARVLVHNGTPKNDVAADLRTLIAER